MPTSKFAVAPEDLQQTALQVSLARAFLGVTAMVCLLGIIASQLAAGSLPPTTESWLLLGHIALAATCLIGLRLPPGRVGEATAPVVLGALTLITAVAWFAGQGLQASGLVFFGLAVFLACTIGSQRLGLAAAGLALLAVLGLAWGERAGGLLAPAGAAHLSARLVIHASAIVAGALMGRALASLMRSHLHAANAREQRFRALLGIASNAYWETDAELRLSQVSWCDESGHFVPVSEALGNLPGQVARLVIDAGALKRLHRAMRTGTKLRDLPFCWRRSDGELLHCLASGEPRLDTQGRLIGYWGVARDITVEHQAGLALARSQSLLASVVSLSPDIITLTRLDSGRYAMVNDGFSRLLGYEREEVLGRTAADFGLWQNAVDRARLIHEVETLGAVQDQLIDFNTRAGQRLPLLVSGRRVDNDGQSYLLMHARDMSEAIRVQLEREAILANASVGIAFLRDRRFMLANTQFEQMYGWSAGALLGQPAQAVFADEADYAALDQAVTPTLLRGLAVDLERPAQRRDGSPFLVRLRAKAIDPMNPGESGTIWIAEDVTAARQAKQDLARARDAAEAANRAKSAFLANTSHEIRTPLHGVLGLVRLARQPGLAPERQRQLLDQIDESADLLAAVITDTLDMAKIEAGKLLLEVAAFDLQALLSSLAQEFKALAAGRGLAFTAQVDPALPTWVQGDALRVRQILANFLHNALKFTASGSIRLVAEQRPDGPLRFEVHDTGPGIATTTQDRLFEPFTQADESTTRQFGGTGLGLSISRELATLMGGSVGLSSAAGIGSCFHADLPLPAVQAGCVMPPLAADSAGLRGARVLLVEDNSVNMMIGAAMLAQWGVEVTEAGDGHQALAAVAVETAEGRRFDAVLMDLQMPGMGGYEATRRLRQQHSCLQLPVIALTAAALVSERAQALAIGMNDFLTKPIDPIRLQAALLRAMPEAPECVD